MKRFIIFSIFFSLTLCDALTIINSGIADSFPPWAQAAEKSRTEYHASDYRSLNAAVTAIGSSTATLVIESSAPLNENISIPSNITVKMSNTGSISRGNYRLAINGAFDCGLHKVFNGSGAITFATGSVKEVYPQWWGAKVDGVTDDTQALQSAITSHSATKLTPGTYLVSSPLYLSKNKSLSGSGRYTTVIKGSGTMTDAVVVMASQSSLNDITADANKITALSGVHITRATGAAVKNIRATNATYHGIALTDSSNCVVENVEADNCIYRGIIIDPNSNHNKITGVHCHDNGAAGILIGHNSSFNMVSNFTIETTGNCGVWIHNASYSNTVANGTIKSPVHTRNYPAILIALNAYKNSISNISIYGHDRGIVVRAGPTDQGYAAGDTRQNTFSNIFIQGNGSYTVPSAGVVFESTDGGRSKNSNNVFTEVVITGFESGYSSVNSSSVDTSSNIIQDGDVSVDVKHGVNIRDNSPSNGNNRIINLNGYTPAGQSKSIAQPVSYAYKSNNDAPLSLFLWINVCS